MIMIVNWSEHMIDTIAIAIAISISRFLTLFLLNAICNTCACRSLCANEIIFPINANLYFSAQEICVELCIFKVFACAI